MSRSKQSRQDTLKRQMKWRPPGRRGPGQPKGTRHSLLMNPKFFEMAAFQALSGLEIGEFARDRFRLVKLALTEVKPISIEMLEDFLVVLSAHYSDRMRDFDARVDRLARDMAALPTRLKADERAWLAHSAGCIEGFLMFMAARKYAAAWRALDLLRRAGWGEVLDRLRNRIEAALRTNIPPFDPNGLHRRGRARLRDFLDRRDKLLK